MLQLAAATDTLELVTSAAGSIDYGFTWADLDVSGSTPVLKNTGGRKAANIATATTTTAVMPAPAANTLRKCEGAWIRNKSATVTNDVTVQINMNGTLGEIHKETLRPGEALHYEPGEGWYKLPGTTPALLNESTSAQTGFAADAYLTGSSIVLPAGAPLIGTTYIVRWDVTKTAAGLAAAVLSIRVGTAGTTADTARLTFTWGAQTAAIDTGFYEAAVTFRTVGSGTSAVLIGRATLANNLASTGLSSAVKTVVSGPSSGFDSTTANLIIGASWNGGASAAHTVQLVRAELIP